jgi:hypothetical protein
MKGRNYEARQGIPCRACFFAGSGSDGLAAELAAVGRDWDLGEALGTGFVGGGFRALDAGE